MTRRFSGARLREAREARGVAAERLAIALHPLPFTIAAVEAGDVIPTTSTIARIAAVIGVEPRDLFEEVAREPA